MIGKGKWNLQNNATKIIETILGQQITESEIENVINTIKKGKATGPENITIDLLIYAGSSIYRKLSFLVTTLPQRNDNSRR